VVALVQVICTKVRDGNKRIVQLKEGDPTGRHVVIVDDLVQSGGTLIECQVSLLISLAMTNELLRHKSNHQNQVPCSRYCVLKEWFGLGAPCRSF
jgi:predicted amidophosphoribosyltransferase